MASLAMLSDFPEENWPSMDVVAAGLHAGFQALDAPPLQASRHCASYRRRATLLSSNGIARNVDRLWNRMLVYPRYARTLVNQFDAFHVVDHSYSHLIHQLPRERTGVYCHDLDTFRCLLQPEAEPRPRWFRAMAERILSGMRRAAVVFHSTNVIREQILRYGLVDANRLVKAPYGVAAEFRPAALGNSPAVAGNELAIAELRDRPFILHVGSCIPRKRIDVLLDVFAAVKRELPQIMLFKIGGDWTAAQTAQIERLGIADAIVHRPLIERARIAAAYRAAKLTLVTSEAEGFGLPVTEGLACGGVVIASDIPVLHEVGDDAVLYAPLGDIPAWTELTLQVLRDAAIAPAMEKRLARASLFTWKHHAEVIGGAYQSILAH